VITFRKAVADRNATLYGVLITYLALVLIFNGIRIYLLVGEAQRAYFILKNYVGAWFFKRSVLGFIPFYDIFYTTISAPKRRASRCIIFSHIGHFILGLLIVGIGIIFYLTEQPKEYFYPLIARIPINIAGVLAFIAIRKEKDRVRKVNDEKRISFI